MKTKILDCTIRDGGYLNNWQYSSQLVKDLYRAVSKSGVDYIEIGFRSTETYFNKKEMGIWRFTPEEVVDEIKSEVSGAAISLMVDYGKVDIEDIPEASKSNVSMYRVAAHKNKVTGALELCEAIADKGYTVTIQLMGIAGYTPEDFRKVISPLKNSSLTYVYFADSYGSLIPADIEKYITVLRDTDKPLGFHPHNNLQLAFANTLEAIRYDIEIIDGTVFGMGRGSGNLPLETLIAYFEKTVDDQKYNALPVLELIDKHFIKLSKENSWGHNLPYMISGAYEVHPNYAGELIESGKYSIEDIQSVLKLINIMNPVGFDKNIIPQIEKLNFFSDDGTDDAGNGRTDYPEAGEESSTIQTAYKDRHKGCDFLVLANGPSLIMNRDKINKFIEMYDPVLIGSNYLGGLFVPHYHSFNDKKRFEDQIDDVHPSSKLLLSRTIPDDIISKNTNRDYEIIYNYDSPDHAFNIDNGLIVSSCRAVSVLSIAVAVSMGAKRIFVAGMDGYKDAETFIARGIGSTEGPAGNGCSYMDISARSGEYSEQMAWHNSINRQVREINEYLISKGLSEVIIITPTTHKAFYKDMESFLLSSITK